MLITGNQLRAARALAEVDQLWVADRAQVSVNTIRNMEGRGDNPITSGVVTVRRVQASLEAAGIAFTNGGEPGVKLKRTPYAIPEAPFFAGLKNAEYLIHSDAQYDGTRVRYQGNRVDLVWRDRFIGTAFQRNGSVYFDPAPAGDGVTRNNVAPIFLDWAGRALRRALDGNQKGPTIAPDDLNASNDE